MAIDDRITFTVKKLALTLPSLKNNDPETALLWADIIFDALNEVKEAQEVLKFFSNELGEEDLFQKVINLASIAAASGIAKAFRILGDVYFDNDFNKAMSFYKQGMYLGDEECLENYQYYTAA